MPLPRVSIVIPTYNRPQLIKRSTAACLALNYPPGLLEVIVVDDGSHLPLSLDPRVRLIRQQNAGPATARNRGVLAATGELIAFTDDDCIPEPDWLLWLAQAFKAQPDALLGGHTCNSLTGNSFAAASQSLIDYLYLFFAASCVELRFFTSNNLAAARALLIAKGGFNPAFPLPAAEDRDLSERWGLLVYIPEARIGHSHALSLFSFLRQHFRYGRGAYTLSQLRSRRGVEQQWKPHLMYPGLVRFVLADPNLKRPGLVLALIALAQLANLAGCLVQILLSQPATNCRPGKFFPRLVERH